MKEKVNVTISAMICLALIISLPLSAFALTDRAQYNQQGNFVPNQFAEGDAIRYGGLFGPLQEAAPGELTPTALNNPELVDPFAGLRNVGRDMGFGTNDSDRFPAITKKQCSYGDCS